MLPWIILVVVILLGIIPFQIASNEISDLRKRVRNLKDRNDELIDENQTLRLDLQELRRKKIKEEVEKESSNKLSDSKRSEMISYIRNNRHRCIHQIDSRAYASNMYDFDDTVLELLYYQVYNSQPYDNEVKSSSGSSDSSSSSSDSSSYEPYSGHYHGYSHSDHDHSSGSDGFSSSSSSHSYSGSSSHSHSSSYDSDYSSSSSSGWDSSSSSYDSGSSGGDW